MTKRMLIDATQKEETRVAVIKGDFLEDFDYENILRKPLKGNIYLAKVTRVEPSLQAAFVNYGGNRHGFLSFSEIHPDYFKIPVADREALLAEHEEAMRADEERAEREAEEDAAREAAEHGKSKKKENTEDDNSDLDTEAEDTSDENEDADSATENDSDDDDADDDDADFDNENEDESDETEDDDQEDEDGDDEKNSDNNRRRRGGRNNNRRGGRGGRGRAKRNRSVERYENEETRFRMNLRRRYKIQEVVKRGQIMLIQVNKEERGNKGAAVSTYLSLPGRYCVLMPNSPRGGGVSRKISNYKDRNRMREIMKELEVPKGMSVILRTAGVERTKTEIKRDLDYLVRLWNNIREMTLESTAPAVVYEEADLIKRAVRDFYTRDVDEIMVSGAEGYKAARNFMKMLIPSHAKKVKEYKNKDISLFGKYNVEHHIAEIGETQVSLPSGGYLVINPTEALVSIDVNSGRATKERHIEETALRTNLEAAVEVARQLRLRDLGGLVVIDFIDMENRRNNGKVERKMRDALSADRARVQVGRISNFGLMELSRQRMSASLTESQFEPCKTCGGSGRTRTPASAAVMILRGIAQEGQKNRAEEIIVSVPTAAAIYILNYKRRQLAELEEKFGFKIIIRTDDGLSSDFTVEVSIPKKRQNGNKNKENNDTHESDNENEKKPNKRNRRGRNRRKDDDDIQDEDAVENAEDATEKAEDEKPKRTRRGRKPKPKAKEKADDESVEKTDAKDEPREKSDSGSESEKSKPKPKRTRKKKEAADSKDDKPKTEQAETAEAKPAKKSGRPKKAPNRTASKKPEISNDDQPEQEAKALPPEPKDYETVNEAPSEKKKGWWNKLKN